MSLKSIFLKSLKVTLIQVNRTEGDIISPSLITYILSLVNGHDSGVLGKPFKMCILIKQALNKINIEFFVRNRTTFFLTNHSTSPNL